MHTDNGFTIYDTFDELLNADLDWVYEDNQYYYIQAKSDFVYSGTAYRVDKRTKCVERMHFLKMINGIKNAEKTDPKTIKGAS